MGGATTAPGRRQRSCSMPARQLLARHCLVPHPSPRRLACRLDMEAPRRATTTTTTGAAGGGTAARHITARGGGAAAARGGAAATRPCTTATGLRAGAPRPLLHAARRTRLGLLAEATLAGLPRLGAMSRRRRCIGGAAGAGLAVPPRHRHRCLERRCCQAATGPRRMAAARGGASEAAAWTGSGGGAGAATGWKHLPVNGRWGALALASCGESPGGVTPQAVSEAGTTRGGGMGIVMAAAAVGGAVADRGAGYSSPPPLPLSSQRELRNIGLRVGDASHTRTT